MWLHAASVGEVGAAAPLVERLRAGGEALLLSTTSVTGLRRCAELHPELPRRLAPLDLRCCVEAALRRSPPRALVLIEAELWPTWIRACSRRGIPVVLVSARVSDRSFRRHLRLGSWVGRTLRRLHAIGARSELDRERFLALGAPAERLSLTGDLKLDVPAVAEPSPELARWLGKAPLVIGGSIHPGEDRALLAARSVWMQAGQEAALLVAPRHPKRVAEVVETLRRAGIEARLRSESGPPLAAGEVGVLDSLGELAAAYTRARVAFVGGSLVPVGGHNLLEPVRAGAPVCFGPHVEQQRHTAEWLEAAGAGQRVADSGALARALCAALAEPEVSRARAEAGRRVIVANRGSSERAAALVLGALAERAEAGIGA